jgi:hypothetical protein
LDHRLVRRPRDFDDTTRSHVATSDNNTTRSNNTARDNAARNASSCNEVILSLRTTETRRANWAGRFHSIHPKARKGFRNHAAGRVHVAAIVKHGID